MKRFFAFGCSFTRYRWPTWADIVALESQEYHNWGKGGGGNHFIFYSLMEAIKRHNINHDDTVMIMWTSAAREDRYCTGWHLQGSVYNNNLDEDRIDKQCDPTGYMLTSVLVIDAARRVLDSLGCRYRFLSMVPISIIDETNMHSQILCIPGTTDHDIITTYQDLLDTISPSIFDIVFQRDWHSRDHIRQRCLETETHEYLKTNYQLRRQWWWPDFDIYINGDAQLNGDLDWRRDCLRQASRLDQHATPEEHLMYLDNFDDLEITEHQRCQVRAWQQQVCENDSVSWISQSCTPDRF